MYEVDFFQAFKVNIKNFEDKTAIFFGDQEISYKRFLDAVGRLAFGLAELGVSKGDRVAILLPNWPQFIISYFALLKMGAVAMPVDGSLGKADLLKILNDTNARGAIVWEQSLTSIQEWWQKRSGILIVLGERTPEGAHDFKTLIASSEPLTESIGIEPSKTALIAFTAGSLEKPKGVRFNHKNLCSQIDCMRKLFLINSEDTVLCTLPHFRSYGLAFGVNLPLQSLSATVLPATGDAREIAKILTERQVSVFVGRPATLNDLIHVDLDREKLSHLKCCITIGPLLSRRTRSEFEKKFNVPIYAGYSLSEAGPLVSVERFDVLSKKNAVGLPTYGIQVRIVDENREEVQTGEVGEIAVRGPNLMQGYLTSNEHRTDLQHDWFYTGDLGQLDADGHLSVIDRRQNVIQKGGFHVYPREVRSTLSAHPDVEECAVVGIPDRLFGREVKAYVVLKSDSRITKEELMQYCQETLPVYKCPKTIEITDKLHENSKERFDEGGLTRNHEIS